MCHGKKRVKLHNVEVTAENHKLVPPCSVFFLVCSSQRVLMPGCNVTFYVNANLSLRVCLKWDLMATNPPPPSHSRVPFSAVRRVACFHSDVSRILTWVLSTSNWNEESISYHVKYRTTLCSLLGLAFTLTNTELETRQNCVGSTKACKDQVCFFLLSNLVKAEVLNILLKHN